MADYQFLERMASLVQYEDNSRTGDLTMGGLFSEGSV